MQSTHTEQAPQSASDLAAHFLPRLDARDVEQALVNAGYLENGIRGVEYERSRIEGGRTLAQYRVRFYDAVEGSYGYGNVFVRWDPASSRYLGEPSGCPDRI
jgi:hypothetical protein